MKINGIARYCHLITPSTPPGADKSLYSVDVLIHKEDNQWEKIKKTITDAVQIKWGASLQKKLRSPIKILEDTEPENDFLKNYMSIKCHTSSDFGKPILVDENLEPIIDPACMIEGKIVWVSVNIAAYSHPLNSGVAAYLQGVLVTTEKGSIPEEAFYCKPTAKSLFSDVINNISNEKQTNPDTSFNTPYIMTPKAQGHSREDFISKGFTDEYLIKEGYMLPPSGITPSFI